MAKHAGPHNAVTRLICRAVFLCGGISGNRSGSADQITHHGHFLPHNVGPRTYPCSRRGRFRRRHGEAAEEAAPSEGAGLAIPRLAYCVVGR